MVRLVSCTVFLFASLPLLFAQETQRQTEVEVQVIQRLEAGFISQFPAYITWPKEVLKSHPNSIPLGLIGSTTLGEAGIDYLTARGYSGRRFVVTKVREYSPEELGKFEILYIGQLPEEEMKQVLKMVKRQPVLTVSRQVNFIKNGGIVQMMVADRAVTFQVSNGNATTAGLVVDPRLVTWGKIMTPLPRYD